MKYYYYDPLSSIPEVLQLINLEPHVIISVCLQDPAKLKTENSLATSGFRPVRHNTTARGSQ